MLVFMTCTEQDEPFITKLNNILPSLRQTLAGLSLKINIKY